MVTRRNFTPATRKAAYERAQGRCQGCGCDLTGKRWDCDHVLPDWLGGRPVLENAEVLCAGSRATCHGKKTAADVKRIAKTRRQRRYHETGRSHRHAVRPMRSRGFQGWRRFDGQIVRAHD